MTLPALMITQDEAVRVLTELQTGSLEIVKRMGVRLHALVPDLMGKDAATIASLIRVETDQAAVELTELEKRLTHPMEH